MKLEVKEQDKDDYRRQTSTMSLIEFRIFLDQVNKIKPLVLS